jgi:hypothetical protein
MVRYALDSIALLLREHLNYTKDSLGQKVRIYGSFDYDTYVNRQDETVSLLIKMPEGTQIIAEIDPKLNILWNQAFLYRLHPENQVRIGVEPLDTTNRYHAMLIAKQYTSFMLQKVFSMIGPHVY